MHYINTIYFLIPIDQSIIFLIYSQLIRLVVSMSLTRFSPASLSQFVPSALAAVAINVYLYASFNASVWTSPLFLISAAVTLCALIYSYSNVFLIK